MINNQKDLLESLKQNILETQNNVDDCIKDINDLKRKKNRLTALQIATSLFAFTASELITHSFTHQPLINHPYQDVYKYYEKIIVSNHEPIVSNFIGLRSEDQQNQLIEVSDWKKIDQYYQQTTTTYTLDDLTKKEFDEVLLDNDILSAKIKSIDTKTYKVKEEPTDKSGSKSLKVYYEESKLFSDFEIEPWNIVRNELLLFTGSSIIGAGFYFFPFIFTLNRNLNIKADLQSKNIDLIALEEELKKLKEKRLNLTKK